MATRRGSRRTGTTYDVLIADDDESFRDALADLFKAEGFDVECVGTVDEALNAVSRAHYDVVVLDMVMPEHEGKEIRENAGLLAATRVLHHYADLTEDDIVVVFTGYPNAADCFATMDVGAYYLPKNVPDTSMSGELVRECKRRLKKRQRRTRTRKRTWLVDHYKQLADEFGGKAVAILDAQTDTGRLKTASIGGRKVIAAPNADILRKRIIKNPTLRAAMPLILEIW